MAFFSSLAMTPAAVPASTVAIISSEVILSLVRSGRPKRRMIILANPLKNHTKGRRILIKKLMGPIMAIAIDSGATKAKRLGIRSANRINKVVDVIKPPQKPTL